MKSSTPPLEKILSGCLNGERSAQHHLFRLYSRPMLSITTRYTKDYMEAEDIMMIGFGKIFSRISTYNGCGSFEGWMKKIMVNSALTMLEKNKRSVSTAPLEDSLELHVDDLNNKFDTDHLLSIFEELPATLKFTFKLYAIEGYSHKEIASIQGISESVSKVRVTRARRSIKARLVNPKVTGNDAKDFHSKSCVALQAI